MMRIEGQAVYAAFVETMKEVSPDTLLDLVTELQDEPPWDETSHSLKDFWNLYGAKLARRLGRAGG